MESNHQPVVRAGNLVATRDARLTTSELMPPEKYYRPRGASITNVLATFISVFAFAFVTLWMFSSMWPVLMLLTVYLLQAVAQRSRQMKAVKKNQQAVALLNAGHVEEAATIFESLAKTERSTSAHPVYVFNRGVTYLLQGRVRRAYSLFNAVQRSRTFIYGFGRSYQPLMYIELASSLALMGRLDEAQRYRDKAFANLDPTERGRLAFVDAIINIRNGDPAGALTDLAKVWDDAEGLIRVPTLKALRLIRAFAMRECGRDTSREFRAMLAGVTPFRHGEFDWVGAEWPELMAFLTTHGFR